MSYPVSKVDLIFQKQPIEVQQKLLQLLLQYNASLQYNSKEDKFEVDLLLPFKDQYQKRGFLEQYYRSRQSGEDGDKKSQEVRSKGNQSYQDYDQSVSSDDRKVNLLLIQHDKGQTQRQEKKSQKFSQKVSDKLSAQSFQEKDKQIVKSKEKDLSSVRDSTSVGFGQLNFESLSRAIDKRLKGAIKHIQIQKKSKNSQDLSSFVSISGLERDKSAKGQQYQHQQQSKSFSSRASGHYEKTPSQNHSVNNGRVSNEQKQQLIQSSHSSRHHNTQETNTMYKSEQRLRTDKDPRLQPSVPQSRFRTFVSNSPQQLANTLRYQPSNPRLQDTIISPKTSQTTFSSRPWQSEPLSKGQQYNQIEDYDYNSNKNEILIQDSDGYYDERNLIDIDGKTNKDGNKNYPAPSFMVNRVIQEEETDNDEENQQGESLFKKRRMAQNDFQSERYDDSLNSRSGNKQHKEFLEKKYQKGNPWVKNRQNITTDTFSQRKKHNKSLSPNSTLKKSYKTFFSTHKAPLQHLYTQIRSDIQKHHLQSAPSPPNTQHQNTSKTSSNNSGILVIDQNPILIENSQQSLQQQESMEFQKEVMRQYQQKVLVNNQALSSQDLVRYFKYLLKNARGMYVRFLRNKGVE